MNTMFTVATTMAVIASAEYQPSIMETTHAMRHKQLVWDDCAMFGACPAKAEPKRGVACVNGMAGEYPCSGVDMESFIPLRQLRPEFKRDGVTRFPVGNSNDIWGWTDENDPSGTKEYAIMCLVDGTVFIDVTNPKEPKTLGFLEDTTARSCSWRDAKVFNDHVFIGSECGPHGMQIVDLKRLRDMPRIEPSDTRLPPHIDEDAHYDGFGSSHNIVLNEESGHVFAVGARGANGQTCQTGLHMVDVRDPLNPRFAGCFDNDGYTHDAQCIIYPVNGPSVAHRGREICFAYNEDSLTIVDVTTKMNPIQISRVEYQGSQYTHQGWLTDDFAHVLMNDELDEMYGSNPRTRTLVWNVEDLANPFLENDFFSDETAVDHNLYIRNNVGYLSNYCAGLRIMDTSNARNGITQAGYFDVAPDCSSVTFLGTWSNYPYYNKEGSVAVTSIERGFFMLQLQDELLNKARFY